MTTRTTHSHKEAVTSLEIQNAIDLCHVSNGILEEHQVHLNKFGLHVVILELVDQELSEFVEVGNFFVDLHVLVEEVNEHSIFTICHAVLFVVELELLLNLFIQVPLEEVTISEGVKSVVEYTKYFMRP